MSRSNDSNPTMGNNDNDNDNDNPQEEIIHFLELNETLDILKQQSYNNNKNSNKNNTRLREIFDRYLEFPTLLDPHLQSIIIDHPSGLATKCRNFLQRLFDDNHKNDCTHKNSLDVSVSVMVHALNEELITLQTLCKVRGFKTIQRFLPHEASDLEPVLYSLSTFGSSSDLSWEGIRVLFIWLAMLLSSIPFDLDTIVSIHNNTDDISIDELRTKGVIYMIQNVIQQHLNAAGPTREAAALCMASLLARPDVPTSFCNRFLDWSLEVLADNKHDIGNTYAFLKMGVVQTLAVLFKIAPRTSLLIDSAEQMGRLWEVLIIILEDNDKKQRPNLVLRKLLIKLFARVGCAYLPPKVAEWRYQRGQRSLFAENKSVERTESSKAQHEQLDSLNNDEENEIVRSEIEDVIEMLLRGLCDEATVVRWSSAKGIGRITERLPSDCADDVVEAVIHLCNDRENDNAWHGACLALAELSRRGLLLPKRLDTVTPIIVKAIQYDVKRGQHSVGAHVRDAACYTCWAFARAYDPSVLKPHIPDLSREMVLACLFDREVNGRRAASAAFQECVGRQGAHNFKHGIDILTKADYFSIGNLKESYTTVASSIAAYDEYRSFIIDRLWKVKLRHWDLDIRLLASDSLFLMTIIDLDIVIKTVLPPLCDLCLHKDFQVRHGAILGVAEIVRATSIGTLQMRNNSSVDKFDPDIVMKIIDLVPKIEGSRLYRGHGGEFMRGAVCRLIECISMAKLTLSVKLQVRYLDSIDASLVHPKEDISRAAVAALKVLMQNYFPVGPDGPSHRLRNRVVCKYIQSMRNESNPGVTRGFALALGSLPKKLLAPDETTLHEVISCLHECSKVSHKVGDEPDAETRRNSILSLVNVCKTVGIGKVESAEESSRLTLCVNKSHLQRVFMALFEASNDYGVDRRGDVGSWCRLAAIESLEALTYAAVQASSTIPSVYFEPPKQTQNRADMMSADIYEMLGFFEEGAQEKVKKSLEERHPLRNDVTSTKYDIYFDASTSKQLFSVLLKQFSEKLDTVRLKAGTILCNLLTCTTPRIPFIPHRTSLVEALVINESVPSLSCQYFDDRRSCFERNWGNAAETFPLVLRAINLDSYFSDIIAGLVISVGGITESVVKNASLSMIEWIKALEEVKAFGRISRLGHVFIDLFDSHHSDGRVILPLLRTIDKLISHGCLDNLLNNPNNQFCEALVTKIKLEEKKCSDVKRLLAIIDVLSGMLEVGQRNIVKDQIFPFLIRLLSHRYPKVRRACAETLYLKIQDCENFFETSVIEIVSTILLTTSWDAELEGINGARENTNKVADQLGIKLPDSVRNGKTNIAKFKQKDELESYSSLVKEAGR